MSWFCLALLLGETPATGSVQQARPKPAVTLQMCYEAAAADLVAIPPQTQKYIRYLMLTLPQAEWQDSWHVNAYHCNNLSTEGKIVRPRPLACGSVVAIDIRNYGWSPELFERLAAVYPYLLFKTEAEDEKGKNLGKRKIPLVYGEAQKAATYLISATKSEVPVLFADWFFWQTVKQEQRNPGYYDFLKIGKKEKELDEFVGFDAKLAKRYPKDVRERVKVSGITKQSRAIDGTAIRGGWYWFTGDVVVAQGNKNPLQNLDNKFVHDARESLFHLPNGLVGSALFNGNGDRQDKAPDNIVRDEVNVNLDCQACHGPHGMFQPITGFIRGQYQKPKELKFTDFNRFKTLDRLYLSQIEPPLDDSRRTFVRALAECNGWDPTKNAREYGEFYRKYNDGRSFEQICRDTGASKEVLTETIRQYVASLPETVEPVIESLIEEEKVEPNTVTVRRPNLLPIEVYHETYPKLMFLLAKREGKP